MQNLGMRVRLVNKVPGIRNATMTLRNVTEIHYMHDSVGPSVAFESDIHGSGMNLPLAHIAEFETTLETEKAETF